MDHWKTSSNGGRPSATEAASATGPSEPPKALVIEIIQGKTTVAEASRSFDLSPSEIEGWVDDARRGMENALRANPLDVRQEYEKQLRDLQEAYGEAMLELRARKKLAALMEREDDN